jgi:hypothetical protein
MYRQTRCNIPHDWNVHCHSRKHYKTLTVSGDGSWIASGTAKVLCSTKLQPVCTVHRKRTVREVNCAIKLICYPFLHTRTNIQMLDGKEEKQLDATITVYWQIQISSTCFGQQFCSSSGALDCAMQLVVWCTQWVVGQWSGNLDLSINRYCCI